MMWASECSVLFTHAAISEVKGEHLFFSVLPKYCLSLLSYSCKHVPEVELAQGLCGPGATTVEGSLGVCEGRREL